MDPPGPPALLCFVPSAECVHFAARPLDLVDPNTRWVSVSPAEGLVDPATPKPVGHIASAHLLRCNQTIMCLPLCTFADVAVTHLAT